MIEVTLAGQTVQVQVQSSGLGRSIQAVAEATALVEAARGFAQDAEAAADAAAGIGVGGAALKANNLSDLTSAFDARGNLGLGEAALLNVGTTAGTVAAGDDVRFSTGSTSDDGFF